MQSYRPTSPDEPERYERLAPRTQPVTMTGAWDYANDPARRWQADRRSITMGNMPEYSFTDDELLAYLDEMLALERMACVESALRDSESLRHRLASLARRRDQGVHSVGEIWRRRRASCPTRSQLGSYLLSTLQSDLADYIDFHLQTVGCRYCQANLRDLEEAARTSPETGRRRQKFFQSSAGYLRRGENDT
jgi:hypothetical protein